MSEYTVLLRNNPKPLEMSHYRNETERPPAGSVQGQFQISLYARMHTPMCVHAFVRVLPNFQVGRPLAGIFIQGCMNWRKVFQRPKLDGLFIIFILTPMLQLYTFAILVLSVLCTFTFSANLCILTVFWSWLPCSYSCILRVLYSFSTFSFMYLSTLQLFCILFWLHFYHSFYNKLSLAEVAWCACYI